MNFVRVRKFHVPVSVTEKDTCIKGFVGNVCKKTCANLHKKRTASVTQFHTVKKNVQHIDDINETVTEQFSPSKNKTTRV